MKILNLGCGGERPKSESGVEWTNMDNLHELFPPGTPQRMDLDGEPNYVNADISKGIPLFSDTVDGVLLSHVLEHFDAQDGLLLLKECRRVLRPGGYLLVSVPDASYFKRVYPEDCNENWPRLYDVTDVENPIPTFFEAALWFDQHKAVLTRDSLWCYLTMAGFEIEDNDTIELNGVLDEMYPVLNRGKFSLIMRGKKNA